MPTPHTDPRFLRLSSGLGIAWDEYGDPAGEPVFFCHGWPGSRRQAIRLDATARDLGLRLISLDRPGVCLSERPERRTLLDWPILLAEVAEQLHITRFRIIGVSGGGPYALVTAAAFPDRVTAAAIVCGAPPLAEMHDRGLLSPVYRVLLRIHDAYPNAVRALFRTVRPFVQLPVPRIFRPIILRMLNRADASALADPEIFATCHDTFREAWAGSADGVFADAQIYALPWGFKPEEIRVPVAVWHGREDRNFRWPLAEALAARIPGAQFHLVENEGHYSLPFRQTHPILAGLRTT